MYIREFVQLCFITWLLWFDLVNRPTNPIQSHYDEIHVRMLRPGLPAGHPEYAHTCTGSEAHGRTLKKRKETIILPTRQSRKLPRAPTISWGWRLQSVGVRLPNLCSCSLSVLQATLTDTSITHPNLQPDGLRLGCIVSNTSGRFWWCCFSQ